MVKVWQYFVVGDLLKIVKTRVSFFCFEDGRGNFVSNRAFVIGRRMFRGPLGAFKAADDPGWQNARRGIHRRWGNGGKRAQRRLARSLAAYSVGQKKMRREGIGKSKGRNEMKNSHLNDLWCVRCAAGLSQTL